MNYKIKKVTGEKINETVDYVFAARKQMFSMLDHTTLPHDLQQFSSTYMQKKQTAFFAAYNQNGIIGCIGLKLYDHRFHQFNYQTTSVCEIVKLHVSTTYRRLGLATHLINEVTEYAKQQAVENLYLHTHPFLTGAKETWEKNGFNMITKDEDAIWQTIHMQQYLG